ncbi:S24 family peptidase [Acinetobacter colistiniresistens]|uniref:S24 family peptidase n=1 Tax=Acinetobacter colistiniresistens TaxID=280145 RepID=UPI0012509EE2|nr:S24 family peptidase [Acinetobacter colistiniresistens]
MNRSDDQNSLSSTSDITGQYNFKKRDDRIEFALRHAGVNELQVAQQLEFAQSSLNNYKNGKTKRFQRLAELASFLGVNAVWLHSGEGSPFIGSGKDTGKSLFYTLPMNKTYYENYYNKRTPGKDLEELTIQLPISDLKTINSTNISYIYMPDDSMEDEIRYGSIVVIDESDIFVENGKLYAITVFDSVTIRRTYQINKAVTLKVSNQKSYEDQTFEREDIDSSNVDVLGKVRMVKNYYS